MEMVCLLRGLEAVPASGGPLSEESGVFWVDVPEAALSEAELLFARLGYTCAVDIPVLTQRQPSGKAESVRWRGRHYKLRRIYEEDEDAYRSQAPDSSEFLLARGDGSTRLVLGYRGSSQPGERRGLPVCDARLLVNLVSPTGGEGTLLDPFAGAGGIVRHAIAAGLDTASSDVAAGLAPGLTNLGSRHRVADARQLPFPDGSFDAIATEPPFDRAYAGIVGEAIHELARVLKPSGRMSMLCAQWQSEEASRTAERSCLKTLLRSQIDRKGLDCVVLSWEKQGRQERYAAPR